MATCRVCRGEAAQGTVVGVRQVQLCMWAMHWTARRYMGLLTVQASMKPIMMTTWCCLAGSSLLGHACDAPARTCVCCSMISDTHT